MRLSIGTLNMLEMPYLSINYLYVAIVYSMPSGSHVEMIIGCVVMLLTSYGMDQDLDTKHQIIGCEGLHHQ